MLNNRENIQREEEINYLDPYYSLNEEYFLDEETEEEDISMFEESLKEREEQEAFSKNNSTAIVNSNVEAISQTVNSIDHIQDSLQKRVAVIQKKNLFSLPSIFTIFVFLLSTAFLDIDAALEDEKITPREAFKIVYLIMGGLATVVARGSEPPTQTWTPKRLPGYNKEDINGDGIVDEKDHILLLK